MVKMKDEYLDAFGSLVEGPNTTLSAEEVLETFTCNLYSQAGTKSANMARFDIYNTGNKPLIKDKPL